MVGLSKSLAGQKYDVTPFIVLLSLQGDPERDGAEDDGENEHMDIQPEIIGRGFVGWNSIYDANELNKTDMNEWLDDTIATILNSTQPGNLLEVETRTGMILFNLLNRLQSYVSLEPSGQAVEFDTKAPRSIPELANKATLLSHLRVLVPGGEDLIQPKGAKMLFIGDIRSYAMYKDLKVSKILHTVGNNISKNKMRQKMTEMGRVEGEVLVDPGFFTALQDRLPNLVEHVENLPKNMKATNELSGYRYAAVVHVKSYGGQEQQRQIHDIRQDEWVDFMQQKMDRESLMQLLQQHSSGTSMVARDVINAVDEDTGETLEKTHRCSSLAAVDMLTVARQAGYRAEISST
ncbi:enniatin synthetase [Ilyonectria destructans]|nr:enniatin synthetase [Ilyonectria destructans]